MSTTTEEALTKKDFVTPNDVRWCPGCGDYAILNSLQRTFPELGVARENFVVVSGIGTGGTLQGLYEAFDTAGCAVTPVAALPRENEVFGGNIECCSFKFSSDVPGVVDGVSQLFHEWSQSKSTTGLKKIEVGDCHCLELTRQLWCQGFPVGPSSGLNLGAALEAAKSAPAGAKIVTVFPDRMERYFSHKVFEKISRGC